LDLVFRFDFQQEANITVGKLKCSGHRKASDNSAGSTTCSSLKQDGATQDRFYLTKEESGDTVAATYCQMSKQGYEESNLNTESYDLGGGAKIVLDMALGSHKYGHGTRYTYTTCGQGRNFYTLAEATLKSSFDQIDVHENLNKTEATYIIPETGLYTVIIGNFEGDCDTRYLVRASDMHGNNIIFYKSQYTNTYTHWLTSGVKLQILTTYTSSISSSNFKMTIVKH